MSARAASSRARQHRRPIRDRGSAGPPGPDYPDKTAPAGTRRGT
jgi:hypothetical protein